MATATATATSTKPDEQGATGLPTWLSIPIILVCLACGFYIIHWYVMTDPLSHEAKILGDPPAQPQWGNNWNGPGGRRNGGPGGPGAPGGGNPRRTIRERGDGRWDMRTEQARVDVSVVNGKLNWHTITYMGNYAFVPDDVKNTIYAARALAADSNRLAALKVPQDQARKLRTLASTITMDISEADKNELGAQVLAYVQAPEASRAALEPKVLALLDQVAQKSIPATKQQAADRAAQINQIITPEQWKQDNAMGGGGK